MFCFLFKVLLLFFFLGYSYNTGYKLFLFVNDKDLQQFKDQSKVEYVKLELLSLKRKNRFQKWVFCHLNFLKFVTNVLNASMWSSLTACEQWLLWASNIVFDAWKSCQHLEKMLFSVLLKQIHFQRMRTLTWIDVVNPTPSLLIISEK